MSRQEGDACSSIRLAVVSMRIHGESGDLPFDRLAATSRFAEVRFFAAGDRAQWRS